MPGVLGTASPVSDKPGAVSWRICALVLLVGLAFHLAFVARASFEIDGQRTFSLFDDAMISLTYARNLAAGHGLVWMPGEPAVEGYTNPLWTLLLALPHLAGLPERLVSLPVQLAGALLLAATGLLALALTRRLGAAGWLAPAALAAVVLSYPLAFWTLRGLEVGLVACLVAAAALLALRLAERPSLRDRAALAGVLAAAVSTRIDAGVFVATVVAFLFLGGPRTRRDAAWAGGAALAALGAQSAFRWAYYGALLPNTYYLKMSGHSLAERLVRGLDTFGHHVACTLWVPLGLALALVVVRRGRLARAEALLAALVGAGIAYSIWVGGDAWEWAHFANRYVATALPLLFVLALAGVEALRRAECADARRGLLVAGLFIGGFSLWRLRSYADAGAVAEVLATAFAAGALALARHTRAPAATTALGALLVLAMIGLGNARPVAAWLEGGGLHVRDDERQVRLALALRAATPDDARIAVVWAGTVPYFSHRRAVDLLGKNDPVIAHGPPRYVFWPGHDKWSYEHSIGRLRPDLVVELWKPTDRDRAQMREWGYERVGDTWVREDAAVDRAALGP